MTFDIEVSLVRTRAILEGHFVLSSGLHSGVYFQCARLLAHPEEAAHAGKAIAERFSADKPDSVIAPAIGGIVLAHVVAAALRIPGYFAERVGDTFALRRGFELRQGERVLVVEDVLTTGGSALEVADLVRSLGAIPIGIGALVNRAGASSRDIPMRAILNLNAPLFEPNLCPLCAEGRPIEKPGSRR
ncbi:MAG: orotate phosphoribosyltransferase [Candidatus Hydrogenedentota bacterium]